MTVESLHKIGLRHATDKATYHNYLDFYEKNIDRKNVKRFLEIGVLKGQSLQTWREWFDADCHVEGWDISKPIHIPGCHVKQINQLNKQQMLSNTYEPWDLILDDGGHTTEMQQLTFSTLFPHTKMFIIEDLHAPWCGLEFIKLLDEKTIDLIEKLSEWESRYSTEEEAAYIRENAELVGIYIQGTREEPMSATAVIKNTDLFK